jgi:LysR family transcriptional regulator, hypochlorite-specific transcription factor HypT
MQLKWLEDLAALAQSGSLSRAADLRAVTQPAFGRRIRALEAWAGCALVDRAHKPLVLTREGRALLAQSQNAIRQLELLKRSFHSPQLAVRLVAGRAMVRTEVARWITRMRKAKLAIPLEISTRLMGEAVAAMERDEADFLLGYHHPAISLSLDGRRYRFAVIAQEVLVPVVAVAESAGLAEPYEVLAYKPDQALGILVADHLANLPCAPQTQSSIRCDSVDAIHEYALRGLGLAWLPRSLVSADLAAKRLFIVGPKTWAVPFELRLYRRKQELSAAAEALWDFVVPK